MSRARPAALVIGIAALLLPATSLGVAAADAAPADPVPAVVGVRDEYEAPHGGDFSVDAAAGVLANDTGSGLVAELWNDPLHGTVTLAPDGAFAYVRAERAEDDSFVYLVVDADGAVGDPVKVTIRFANRPPSCAPVRVTGRLPGELVELDLADACIDADGDPLVFSYQQPDVPAGSLWEADAAGHVRFQPPIDWSGTGAVMFTVDDGECASVPVVLAVRMDGGE